MLIADIADYATVYDRVVGFSDRNSPVTTGAHANSARLGVLVIADF